MPESIRPATESAAIAARIADAIDRLGIADDDSNATEEQRAAAEEVINHAGIAADAANNGDAAEAAAAAHAAGIAAATAITDHPDGAPEVPGSIAIRLDTTDDPDPEHGADAIRLYGPNGIGAEAGPEGITITIPDDADAATRIAELAEILED